MRNIKINAPVDTRVLVRTKAGGCYDNKLGVIIERLTGSFENADLCPNETQPAWYRVRFNHPVSIDGTIFESEIFTRRELFPPDYRLDYWGQPSQTIPN